MTTTYHCDKVSLPVCLSISSSHSHLLRLRAARMFVHLCVCVCALPQVLVTIWCRLDRSTSSDDFSFRQTAVALHVIILQLFASIVALQCCSFISLSFRLANQPISLTIQQASYRARVSFDLFCRTQAESTYTRPHDMARQQIYKY